MTTDVVVVSSDAALVDELLRLIAAAGRRATVVDSLSAAADSWASAGLLLLGGDVAAAALPVRDAVVVVTTQAEPTSQTWQLAHQMRAEHVAVLPDAQDWLLERFDDLGATHRAECIGVMGARGAAGSSTVAAALALTAARGGASTCLVDADPLGGGIDLVLACEGVAGSRWPDLAQRSGRIPAATLRESLPTRHGVQVISYGHSQFTDVSSVAVASVSQTVRRAYDIALVDLSRSPDAAGRMWLSLIDRLLLVVPRDVRSLAAASVVLSTLPTTLQVDLITRGPAPGGISTVDVARILGLPVIADWPYSKTLSTEIERGIAPASAARSLQARTAGEVLAELRGAARMVA